MDLNPNAPTHDIAGRLTSVGKDREIDRLRAELAEARRDREAILRERDEARAEVERLEWAVVLLRAGAEDIARGDYANSLARRTAQQMLRDTNDPD